MKKILFVVGPDDNNLSKLQVTEQKFNVNFVGTLPLNPAHLQSVELQKNSRLIVLGIHQKLVLSESPKNYKIVNLVGDSESSLESLKVIEKMIGDLAFNDIVNNPVDVYKTSRIALPRLLGDIEKVIVAKSAAANVGSIAELADVIRSGEIAYPLIIRLSGYHNSKYMKKIDSEHDLSSISDWFEVGRSFILLEYINCLSPDGYYRKARIAVINGRFFPQHFLSSDTWCVGVKDRYKLMMEKSALRNDEQAFLQSFEETTYQKYKETLHQIHKKIGLDIYGIDCFLKENGEIVIFEANPCMDLISMWLGPDNEYDYKVPYRAAVRNEIVRLLSSDAT